MRTTAAGLALALVAGACSTGPEGGANPPPPPPQAAPPSPAPPPVAPVRDQCGAWRLQHLVGRPRSEIPVPIDPRRQRVACTTCPVTQDFSPERINFFYDAKTGLIAQINCG